MSKFHDLLRKLISEGHILISEHGYDELAEDGITAREVIAGIHDAVIVEEYRDYAKGPSWYYKKTEQANLSMLYGVFPGVLINQQFWSQPTGQIRNVGTKTL